MLSMTSYEAALNFKYQKEKEALELEEELMDDVYFGLEDLINKMQNEYEKYGFFIENQEIAQNVIEYLQKEYKVGL